MQLYFSTHLNVYKDAIHLINGFGIMLRMKKEYNGKKLRINPIRIILIFVGLFLFIDAAFYFMLQGAVNGKLWPLDTSFYFYTPTIFGLSVLFCVLSITQTYYEVDKDSITHFKMGKAFRYRFSDIIYIDEKWSQKHKTMLFYLNDGKDRYLAFDKEKIIYEYALQYSHLISREEFKERFPNVKL